jgi:hypothetical protein
MPATININDIVETGDWATDCAHGREVAKARIADARLKRNPCEITAIVRSMAESERYGGIEVGFIFELAAELIQPSI